MKIILEGSFEEIQRDAKSLLGMEEQYNQEFGRSRRTTTEPEVVVEHHIEPSDSGRDIHLKAEASAQESEVSTLVEKSPEGKIILTEQPSGETAETTDPIDTFENAVGIETRPPSEQIDEDPNVLKDSAGVVWDPNIHSSSKATLVNGQWKKRRGGPKSGAAGPVKAVEQGPTSDDALTKMNELISKGVIDYGDIVDILKDIGYKQIMDVPSEKVPELIAILETYETKGE